MLSVKKMYWIDVQGRKQELYYCQFCNQKHIFFLDQETFLVVSYLLKSARKRRNHFQNLVLKLSTKDVILFKDLFPSFLQKMQSFYNITVLALSRKDEIIFLTFT